MAEKEFKNNKPQLTLTEVLVSVATFGVIAVILLPVLNKAQERAKFSRWRNFSSNLRANENLVGFWDFQDSSDVIKNKAFGISADKYNSEDYDAAVGEMVKWGEGRWPGKKAVALPGNGPESVVNLHPMPVLNSKNGAVSIWFKTSVVGESMMLYYAAGENGGDGFGSHQEVHIYLDSNGGLGAYITGARRIYSRENYNDGNWHLAVLNWDEQKIALYVDGGHETVTSGFSDQQRKFTFSTAQVIGKSADNSKFFKGFIDEVAVFNDTLSQDKVLDIYHLGAP